jgi:hypothetical protein
VRPPTIVFPQGTYRDCFLLVLADCNYPVRKMLGTILLIILILILIGALPTWPYSRAWGYYPSSGFGILLIIIIVLLLTGRI